MDLKDLRGRLDSIKQKSSTTAPAPKTSSRPDPGEILLEQGWTRTAPMVYEKVSVVKNVLPEVVSDVLLPEAVEKNIPSGRLIFYDTETTGLSAGAGNIIFLSGFGETCPSPAGKGRDFRITQIFLSDFPGEPAYLERLDEFIKPDRIYVSYNGKSFDSNLLRSRFAMNGRQIEFGPQLDLLYPSRRLWKNIIGGCSLGDIELKILDKKRELDVPGFMVPDLYFEFIRGGGWKNIEGVLAHHLEDISSLAELLSLQERLIEQACIDGVDPMGLAAVLSGRRPEAAADVLSKAFSSGNIRAGIELSLIHKRNGRWEAATGIWRKLWIESSSIFAGIELAKYLEHRAHAPEKAHAVTVELLNLERIRILPYRRELEKRRIRLEQKVEKHART